MLANWDLSGIDIQDAPFPHAVVADVLPRELADELRDRLPAAASFSPWRPKGSNQKLYRPAARLLADRRLPGVWREYLKAVPTLARLAFDALVPSIHAEHPTLEERFGPISRWRHVEVPVDRLPPPGSAGLDLRLILHTAVRGNPAAERLPHVKNLYSLLYGYLDLVADEDRAPGSDYVLFRPREGVRIEYRGRRQELDLGVLEQARVIPRRHNQLVLFVNGPRSIQWISTRGVTDLPLMADHFTYRLWEPVFDLPFAPGAGPTPFGAGLSATRTLRVLRGNLGRWWRGLAVRGSE